MRARNYEIVHDWAGRSEAPIIRQLRTDRAMYTLRGTTVFAEPVTPIAPMPIPVEPAAPAARPSRSFGLTKKEMRVALLLAANKSNEEIARELYISPHTARHHTQAVLGKLGIRSRRDVATRILPNALK